MGLCCCCLRRPLVLHFSNTLSDIWAKYTKPQRASCVTVPLEFETFEDKSSAINADTGVHKRLTEMINKWHLPGMKLAVGKPEYKTIIESKLGITCIHNEIVMEVMWGIQHLMHKLVPKEKAEVAKDDRFPMSVGLIKYLMACGFRGVEPEMINEQIVATACALFDCDAIYKKHHKYLFTARNLFNSVSGINFKPFELLELVTALKVVCFPAEDNDFHEVLSKDQLLKLKEEAPKYKGLLSKLHCMKAYDNISSAHQIRSEKASLLESLLKEAKAAYDNGKLPLLKEAKAAYDNGKLPLLKEAKAAYDNGKLHGESEQIPMEQAEVGIEATPLASQQIPAVQAEVGIEATPLASVGGSKDEAKLLNEHSEQNEVNNIEKQVQVHANAGSGLPPRPLNICLRKTPVRRSPRLIRETVPMSPQEDTTPVRRSPRLIRETVPMSPQEDTRKRRKNTPASSLSLDN